MISRFSDHAANERTYLAWIRTAIVVMGFGFLIERFSLVMQQLELMPKTRSAIAQKLGLHLGSVAGLIMILMGLGIIVVATIRFIRMSRHIDSNDVQKIGIHTDILLAGLLVLIGAGVLVYAAHLVL